MIDVIKRLVTAAGSSLVPPPIEEWIKEVLEAVPYIGAAVGAVNTARHSVSAYQRFDQYGKQDEQAWESAGDATVSAVGSLASVGGAGAVVTVAKVAVWGYGKVTCEEVSLGGLVGRGLRSVIA